MDRRDFLRSLVAVALGSVVAAPVPPPPSLAKPNYLLEFYCCEKMGVTVGHLAGLSRVNFS